MHLISLQHPIQFRQFNPYHPNPEKIDDFDIAGSLGHK